MSNHDLAAELEGYRAELAGLTRLGRADRAAEVRAQAALTVAALRERIAELRAVAEQHEREGRDAPAVQARVEARRLADQLDAIPDLGGDDAADHAPTTTAVPRRGRPKGA